MKNKNKHLYRVHYSCGYMQITFSKKLEVIPQPGLIILDIDPKTEEGIKITLIGNDNQKVNVYFNVLLDRYEVEIILDFKANSLKPGSTREAIDEFLKRNWIRETLESDIVEYINLVERKE